MLFDIPAFKNSLPGRTIILNEIDRIAKESVLQETKQIINENLSFSVALDIATAKGMKKSYVGIVITYVNSELELRNFALDVIELLERHTGTVVKQAVCDFLKEHGLKLEDASAIVTDGASNMSNAFK